MSPEARRTLALQHYHWSELAIGGLVQVYGRSMLIYDMDRSTKGWYAQRMGAREADMRPIPVGHALCWSRSANHVSCVGSGSRLQQGWGRDLIHAVRGRVAKYRGKVLVWPYSSSACCVCSS